MCRLAMNPQVAPGRFFVRGVDTNALYRAERGKTLTFDFDARSDGDISYFRPALLQVGPGYDHYQYKRIQVSVPSDEPGDSSFVAQCALARRAGVRFFSFYAPNLWPEGDGEIEFEVWDKTCDALLAAVPDALIVQRITNNPPDFCKEIHQHTKYSSDKVY